MCTNYTVFYFNVTLSKKQVIACWSHRIAIHTKRDLQSTPILHSKSHIFIPYSPFYILHLNAYLNPWTRFQAPRVKSGTATGAEPFSKEMRVSGPRQHHSAMS